MPRRAARVEAETPVELLIAGLTADELRAFCEGQIAYYKIPHHVRFVDSFPMTVTGKVQKFVMRERMSMELGVHAEATA